jgi:hypothetical protein
VSFPADRPGELVVEVTLRRRRLQCPHCGFLSVFDTTPGRCGRPGDIWTSDGSGSRSGRVCGVRCVG